MKALSIYLTTATLTIFTNLVFASPTQLITHNTTDVDSNAYIAGTIQSQHPTKAHSTGQVSWPLVKIACIGHTVNGQCQALVKMATNTANPVELGTVSMNLETGDITPKVLTGNGYTLIVNGPAETTLSKD